MKLILWCVCLAHGAVVYSVCTRPSLGLYTTVSKQNVLCEISIANDGSRLKLVPKQLKTSGKSGRLFNRQYGVQGKKSQDGWKIVGDFSNTINQDLTVRFTIDAQGRVTHIAITPFTAELYSCVSLELRKISFTWKGLPPPPPQTTFEKKFCSISSKN